MRPLTLLTAASLLSLGLAPILTGCGDAGAEADGSPTGRSGSTGLSQPGAQDFGLFRQILEAGDLPHPDTLDDLGLFAEHKLDYPAAACGHDVCAHALLGVMGDMITGANCTVLQLGLNSPIDPATLERPPLDLVLAIDVSGSMRGDPIDALKVGLRRMLDYLEPDDRVSIVTYSSGAKVLVDGMGLDQRADLELAIVALEAAGKTNIYDGLFTAFQLAELQRAEGREVRVVLLSDGEATSGIESAAKLRNLAEAYASTGIGLTTIGVGASFDVAVMRGLAEVGAGNFYFLEDPQAVREVFTDEVQTFLYPVALDVEIRVVTGLGYAVRGVYGTHGWTGGAAGGVIRVPSLYLAGRTSAQGPIDGGRRGGGGAILLRLAPRALANRQTLSPAQLAQVGQVELSWTDPRSGERLTQRVGVDSPYEPGETPEQGWFTDRTVEKGFVMLNIFEGLSLAAELAQDSDPATAIAVLSVLAAQVERWLSRGSDPDIEDDLAYIEQFIANLRPYAASLPASAPPQPWPVD